MGQENWGKDFMKTWKGAKFKLHMQQIVMQVKITTKLMLPEQRIKDVQMFIVTLIADYESVKEKVISVQIVSLKDIIQNM